MEFRHFSVFQSLQEISLGLHLSHGSGCVLKEMEERRWDGAARTERKGDEEEKRRREGKGCAGDVERRGRNEKGKGAAVVERGREKEKKKRKKGRLCGLRGKERKEKRKERK
jgi:hypothetical protein